MLIAIAVIAVAGIIGAAMYYCHQAVTSDYDFMRGEIDQLHKDLETLKSEVKQNNLESVSANTPEFETIAEYLVFTGESGAYKMSSKSQPEGFERLQDGSGMDISIAPEGIDFFNAYVWADPAKWEGAGMDDEATFYVETVSFDAEVEEGYSTWYGPFEGPLKSLLQ